jgi:hypothetical protein
MDSNPAVYQHFILQYCSADICSALLIFFHIETIILSMYSRTVRIKKYRRFQVLVAVLVKTTFFWNGIPRSMTDSYQHFRETYFFHVQGTRKIQATNSSKTMIPLDQTLEDHIVKHTAILTWVKLYKYKNYSLLLVL